MTIQRDGSSLERALDAAMERERLRLQACRDKAQADQRMRHTHLLEAYASLGRILSSDLAASRGTGIRQRRALPAPSRSSIPAQLDRAGHDPKSEGHPWLKTGAVTLGVLAILLALRVPVSRPAPPPPFEPDSTGDLGNARGAREPASRVGAEESPWRLEQRRAQDQPSSSSR